MMVSREELEKAFKLLDEDKASFRDLAARLGVSKSSLQRWYSKKLGEEIEERRKMLATLEQEISRLQAEFNTLESKHVQKTKLLEEDYQKKKRMLEAEYLAKKGAYEEELLRLKKEAGDIKATFEREGLTWDEGVAILTNVASLKDECERLKGYISKLRAEVSSLEDAAAKARSRLQTLEKDEGFLMAKLSTCYSQLSNLQPQIDEMQQYKEKLQTTIKTLENDKIEIEGEVSRLKEEIAELQKERAEAEASLKVEEARKTEIEEKIKELVNNAGKIVEDAKKTAQRIVENAEEKRTKILHEIGILEREKEKLTAEKDLLEHTIKDMLKKLQQAKEGQNTCRLPRSYRDSESPLESLIERLPTPPPISTRQTRKTRTISTNSN